MSLDWPVNIPEAMAQLQALEDKQGRHPWAAPTGVELLVLSDKLELLGYLDTPNQALRERRREQDERTHEASMRAETERIRQCKDPNCQCKDPPSNWEGTEE